MPKVFYHAKIKMVRYGQIEPALESLLNSAKDHNFAGVTTQLKRLVIRYIHFYNTALFNVLAIKEVRYYDNCKAMVRCL